MTHALAWPRRFAKSLALTLTLSLPQIVTAEGQIMTQDQKDVLAAIQTMTTSFQDGDIASVMNSYETSATVVFEPDAPVSDAAQLEQMFTGMAGVNPVFTYPAGHEVIVTGDIALHISPWTMQGTLPDGQALSQNGLSVAVLRRQDDGSWKMVIDNPHGGRLLADAP